MSDAPNLRARWRGRCAVALLVLGFVVSFVPGLAAGERFVRATEWLSFSSSPLGRDPAYEWVEVGDISDEEGVTVRVWRGMKLVPIVGTAAGELVRSDLGWAAAALTLAISPLLFVWWRFGRPTFGRYAGVLCAAVASISVCVLVGRMADRSSVLPNGVWWTVPLGGALMAAAFLLAPAPRPRDDA